MPKPPKFPLRERMERKCLPPVWGQAFQESSEAKATIDRTFSDFVCCFQTLYSGGSKSTACSAAGLFDIGNSSNSEQTLLTSALPTSTSFAISSVEWHAIQSSTMRLSRFAFESLSIRESQLETVRSETDRIFASRLSGSRARARGSCRVPHQRCTYARSCRRSPQLSRGPHLPEFFPEGSLRDLAVVAAVSIGLGWGGARFWGARSGRTCARPPRENSGVPPNYVQLRLACTGLAVALGDRLERFAPRESARRERAELLARDP